MLKERTRLGGRSARIQAAVHEAVEELSAGMERSELTVPVIAARAGVTPSTIYRRWGGLAELLADVAVQRLRPIADPVDTGTAKGDLLAWAEQYMEEMSSELGRAMLRDVCSSTQEAGASQCCAYTTDHLEVMAERARRRGERFDADEARDQVVAPLMYRILFGGGPLDRAYLERLVDRFMPR